MDNDSDESDQREDAAKLSSWRELRRGLTPSNPVRLFFEARHRDGQHAFTALPGLLGTADVLLDQHHRADEARVMRAAGLPQEDEFAPIPDDDGFYLLNAG